MDKHKLTFTQVVEGYILAQEARQLSVHTLVQLGGNSSQVS